MPKNLTSARAASFLYHELMHYQDGPGEYNAYYKQAEWVISFYDKDRDFFERFRKEALPDNFFKANTHLFGLFDDKGRIDFTEVRIVPPMINTDAIRQHIKNMPYDEPSRIIAGGDGSIKQQMLDAVREYARTHRPDTVKTKQ